MQHSRWKTLQDLLCDALELPSPEREPFLRERCVASDGSPDRSLFTEAASLLNAYETAESSGALMSPFVDLDIPERLTSGAHSERIGPWLIGEMLGSGGMGVVYAAERADGTYRQHTAIKLVHPGFGDAFRKQFFHERNILARLEHPGISRILDGGMTDDDRPYLVMERVTGEPITHFAKRKDLSVRERLALFLQTCDAVAYAHHALVVHRDLKPGHIVVTEGAGAEPSIKLLDFGVAKLLDGEASSVLTRTGPGPLTPAYAAPEQLTGRPVTTATDVYALGVVLYELLALRRPYDLSGLAAGDVERVVTGANPPKPSSVVSAARKRELRGDLDTIVLKALEKDPHRRYPSAAALAGDVRRYLDGEPVQARPSTAGYLLRKFVARHRMGVAASVGVLVVLMGGLAFSARQAQIARAEARKAQAVNEFLVGLMSAADPRDQGRDVRVASLLDQAAERLDTAFDEQPDVEAQLRQALGVTYRELGLYSESEEQLTRALTLRQQLFRSHSRGVIETQDALGTVYLLAGNYRSADSLLGHTLESARRVYGPRDRLVGTLLSNLGYVKYVLGDLPASLEMHRAAVAVSEGMPEPDEVEVAAGLANVAIVLADLERLEEAVPFIERQLDIYRRTYEPGNTRIARALTNLGTVYRDLERHEDAAEVISEAVGIFRQAVGDRNPELAWALGNLGVAQTGLGELVEAETTLQESLAIFEETLGADHPRLAFAHLRLGRLYELQSRLPEAVHHLGLSIALADSGGFQPDHRLFRDVRDALERIGQ